MLPNPASRLIIALFTCALSPLLSGGTLVLSVDGVTVYDAANNITWLANANLPAGNRFGMPLCTGTNVGVQTCINPSGSMNYGAASAWVAAMNAANYLGHADWQLPTTPLLDSNCGKTGPNGQNFGFGCTAGALDTIYNDVGLKSPNTAVPIPANMAGPFNNVQPYLYWSQSVSSAGATSGNATFSFATGWQGANTLPNFLYLWPMIPGKLPGTPATTGTGLQVNPGGATVYDPVTDITWLANANLAATNAFTLPPCTSPTAPSLCVAQDGAMTWASSVQYIANMNAAAYLGQTKWQAPTISTTCPGYGCQGTDNPMGNLFYDQLGLPAGAAAVPTPDISVGPFNNLQPYLYWSCVGNTIQDPCRSAGPAANFEDSYSFGAGFQGTDLVANSLFVTAYFVGSRTATTGPEIFEAANAEGESPIIAPNTWVLIKGSNLAPAGVSSPDCAPGYCWQTADFVNNQLPTILQGVSVTLNQQKAFLYYISPGQINLLTPPDLAPGPVTVQVNNNGTFSQPFTVEAQSYSTSFFAFNGGPYVAARHLDYSLVGPTTLYPGFSTPAHAGETILIVANGFGPVTPPVVKGSETQSGNLPSPPSIQIGTRTAAVGFNGVTFPGLYQFNVTIPPNAPSGDLPIQATYAGETTQPGTLITIH